MFRRIIRKGLIFNDFDEIALATVQRGRTVQQNVRTERESLGLEKKGARNDSGIESSTRGKGEWRVFICLFFNFLTQAKINLYCTEEEKQYTSSPTRWDWRV